MSLTVNDLNKQHNNNARNIVEVNVPCFVGITHTSEEESNITLDTIEPVMTAISRTF